MNKVTKILNKITEFIPLSNYAEMDVADIEFAFIDLLDKYGFDNVGVEAVVDMDEGIFVTFYDDEDDEVTVHFNVDDEYGPVATVVSEDDDQLFILLDPYDPYILEPKEGIEFIDLTDLSWANKTLLVTLLQAGMVGDEYVTEDYTMTVRGKKKQRLPIVLKKDQMRKVDQERLRRAKALGRRLATTKRFVRKVAGGFLM